MSRWVMALGLAGAAVAYGVGCGGGGDDRAPGGGASTGLQGACSDITQACHAVDVEEGEIRDCHVEAHAATSDAECAPRRDRCVALCAAATGADAGDGG